MGMSDVDLCLAFSLQWQAARDADGYFTKTKRWFAGIKAMIKV